MIIKVYATLAAVQYEYPNVKHIIEDNIYCNAITKDGKQTYCFLDMIRRLLNKGDVFNGDVWGNFMTGKDPYMMIWMANENDESGDPIPSTPVYLIDTIETDNV